MYLCNSSNDWWHHSTSRLTSELETWSIECHVNPTTPLRVAMIQTVNDSLSSYSSSSHVSSRSSYWFTRPSVYAVIFSSSFSSHYIFFRLLIPFFFRFNVCVILLFIHPLIFSFRFSHISLPVGVFCPFFSVLCLIMRLFPISLASFSSCLMASYSKVLSSKFGRPCSSWFCFIPTGKQRDSTLKEVRTAILFHFSSSISELHHLTTWRSVMILNYISFCYSLPAF
jgi:hypothetical protein